MWEESGFPRAREAGDHAGDFLTCGRRREPLDALPYLGNIWAIVDVEALVPRACRIQQAVGTIASLRSPCGLPPASCLSSASAAFTPSSQVEELVIGGQFRKPS